MNFNTWKYVGLYLIIGIIYYLFIRYIKTGDKKYKDLLDNELPFVSLDFINIIIVLVWPLGLILKIETFIENRINDIKKLINVFKRK